MADNIAEIKKIFADNGVSLVRDDVWSVQSATVVKHKALERLAAALKIRWQEPKILRAERDEAVILVAGAIGDHMEWSIGEALIVAPSGVGGNYKVSGKQASYIWAMAEKRGKDRVIIKLAGIDAFSEDESDDFKHNRDQEPPAREASPPPKVISGNDADMRFPSAEGTAYLKTALETIEDFETVNGLVTWYKDETSMRNRLLSTEQIGELFRAYTAKGKTLRGKVAA